MDSIDTIFNFYLTALRAGSDDALHSLLEMSPEILPMVVTVYSTEHDSGVHADLVHVVWQQRSADALPILETALNDPVPAVWKQALDGLVVLGSPEARRILLSPRHIRPDRKADGSYTFDEWIADALEQIDSASG